MSHLLCDGPLAPRLSSLPNDPLRVERPVLAVVGTGTAREPGRHRPGEDSRRCTFRATERTSQPTTCCFTGDLDVALHDHPEVLVRQPLLVGHRQARRRALSGCDGVGGPGVVGATQRTTLGHCPWTSRLRERSGAPGRIRTCDREVDPRSCRLVSTHAVCWAFIPSRVRPMGPCPPRIAELGGRNGVQTRSACPRRSECAPGWVTVRVRVHGRVEGFDQPDLLRPEWSRWPILWWGLGGGRGRAGRFAWRWRVRGFRCRVHGRRCGGGWRVVLWRGWCRRCGCRGSRWPGCG